MQHRIRAVGAPLANRNDCESPDVEREGSLVCQFDLS